MLVLALRPVRLECVEVVGGFGGGKKNRGVARIRAPDTTAARRLGMRIWLTSLSTKVMTSPGSRTAIHHHT